jgi:outer membrane protein OmpA-like peptidoglycan-associated protein
VLIVIDSAANAAEAADIIGASSEPNERLIVVDAAAGPGGKVVCVTRAPAAISPNVPSSPVLESDPTSFQLDKYRAAMRAWRAETASLRRDAEGQSAADLARWSAGVTRTLEHSQPPDGPLPGISDAIGDAETLLISSRQAGTPTAGRSSIVVMGQMGSPALPAPTLDYELGGTTVVVAGFEGPTGAQAAWQGALLEAGASAVVTAPPGSSQALMSPIDAALGRTTVHQSVDAVPFGLGLATLTSADDAPLGAALSLLKAHPGVSATVLGTTDAQGGPVNRPLSVARAEVVAAWLEFHGVPASQVVAEGIGPANPAMAVAPDDRRALVIVDPEVQR